MKLGNNIKVINVRAEDRKNARRLLDKRLKSLKDSSPFVRPPRGWIRAIREALGITTTQLANRLRVSQPRAVTIEKAEAQGTIKVETLERVAQALNCELVYALVPKKPLEESVDDRALLIARRKMESIHHTMALEDQSVAREESEEQIRQLAQKLKEKGGSQLWEEDR